MKQRLKELTILVVVVAIIGGIVMTSGVVPIRASSGHWPITRGILTFGSSRSISFHSRGIELPQLQEPDVIRLGASTYDSNCRWCHGRPGLPMPAVASEMTPRPPYLPNVVDQWKSRELFYIGKHGIKFAGMPAWPTQKRDDGIWPVVAFLERFPDVDQQEYDRLTQPVQPSDFYDREPGAKEDPNANEAALELVAEACAACHGFDGSGRAGRRVPALAEQNESYLAASLFAYGTGRRNSGVMQPIAARLNEREIAALASFFSRQSLSSDQPELRKEREPSSTDAELLSLGERIVLRGIGEEKIPSCADCHGPNQVVSNQRYPKLAGLSRWYIERQLELIASHSRGGTQRVTLMHPIADKLSGKQKAAVAAYYQQLRRRPDSQSATGTGGPSAEN